MGSVAAQTNETLCSGSDNITGFSYLSFSQSRKTGLSRFAEWIAALKTAFEKDSPEPHVEPAVKLHTPIHARSGSGQVSRWLRARKAPLSTFSSLR
jgi:hypothetical protein